MIVRYILTLGILINGLTFCAYAQEEDRCLKVFQKTGNCYEKTCTKDCIVNDETGVCEPTCYQKACFQIDVKHCPKRCDIVKGCSGEQICYDPVFALGQSCGGLAYSGQDVECCSGLVKRCGVEFYDGTCDMVSALSAEAVSICIPCGDGVCTQFENRCNCPEDCAN